MLLSALPLFAPFPVPAPAIELRIDASRATRNLFQVTESIPVKAGKVSLSYPKWIPGEHQASGTIDQVIRMEIRARGKILPWTRTTADLYTINVEVPAGVPQLDVAFIVATPIGETFSNQLGRLKWNRFVFLPQGRIADIQVHPYVTPPSGWTVQSALPVIRSDETVEFETVSAERLVDSPVQMGQNARTFDLGNQHYLDVLTERPEQLDLKPELINRFKKLVKEEASLAGARHYRQYRFLLTFSSFAAGEGLEHHESSEDGMSEEKLDGSDRSYDDIGELVAHEMFHSWNGKYRRPKGLATDDFTETQSTELLWVYEGLTEYYGMILAARAGFISADNMKELFALTADDMALHQGRDWRSVADTAVSIASTRNAIGWVSERRKHDYYPESALVWLEVDALIRAKTNGAKSLDDFVRSFHGGKDTGPMVVPYTFDDVVAGLNKVVPNDWASLLRTRFYTPQPEPPVNGLVAAGWDLTYSAQPNVGDAWWSPEYAKLRRALGITVKGDGTIDDLLFDTPADRAGLTIGMKITAVNDRPFSSDVLREVAAVKKPFTLTVQKDGKVWPIEVGPATEPDRPHLTRRTGQTDWLTTILTGIVKE